MRGCTSIFGMADDKVEKRAAVRPLSLSVEEERMKKRARAAIIDRLPAVRYVILWTLIHAGISTFSFAITTAYDMLIHTIFSHPPSGLLPHDVEMTTDAEDTVTLASILMSGMLWCVPPQAAAAAVALMLPRHRRRLRLLLAYAALVVTTAGHGMLAGATSMFGATDPGWKGLFFRTIGTALVFIMLVIDLLCFLGLVLRGGEE